MLGVLFAVTAGITIGAGIIGFICDELSDVEREKQSEMRSEYERYKSEIYDDLEKADIYKKNHLEELRKSAKEKSDNLYESYYEKLIQKKKILLDYYEKNVEIRIKEKELLKNEINETLKLIYETKKQQNSMLRINALDNLTRELQEAKAKIDAYIVYLSKFKKSLKNYDTPDEDIPKPFEFILPEGFLYKGKILFLEKVNIKTKGKLEFGKGIETKYSFDEYDFIKDYGENAIIPLMADNFNYITYEMELSAKKGVFQNTVINNPRIGVIAEVIKYSDRKEIELLYNNAIKLKLPKINLANPNRNPPIGASLRVFPVKWYYALPDKGYVEVSERSSDSLLNFSFEDIPLVFTEEKWNEFEECLEENNLIDSNEEWKISPFDETEIPNVKKVKLQLSTELVFLASVIENNGKAYFSYESLLDLSYLVKPDDIFVPIDSTLNIVLDSDIHKIEEDVYENMNNLSIMAFHEFKSQYQIKASQNGMQYFNKWSEITDKLITFLYKGKSTEIDIERIEKETYFDNKIQDYAYRVYLKNSEVFSAYIEEVYEQAYKRKNLEFFIEMNLGEYAFVDIRNSEFIRLYGSEVDKFLEKSHKSLRIYQKNISYAEQQQSKALHLFRVGKLANPYLQICALNSKNIEHEFMEFDINEFYNAELPNDLSQKEAVEKVLREKNIFLIQGPPGTGKTTVIREIIMQHLEKHEVCNILIVSQANVAVDNVLKGLINKKPKEIIRCGQAEKIDDDIKSTSFEVKYNTYIDRMVEKQNENCDKEILTRWLKIVDAENGYNPDVGELIMKRHRIIGATCVGLAKKRIGLDRMTFDLVVIDEAGKGLPAEILIPIVKAKKVVLIGDHKQLPPTVNVALYDESKIEIDDRDVYEDQLFNESFFYRMFEDAPETNKCMLSTQYRMPAVIGTLVSELFYNENIINGIVTNTKKPFFFESNISLIDMSKDIDYKENLNNTTSVINIREAQFVCELVKKIRKKVEKIKARIAIITPYKGQKRLLIKTMFDNGIDLTECGIDINTVDAFQGDEAEIVLFCTTRAIRPTKYFSDYRRINVALSRAKNELIIIGSLDYFYKFENTSDILPRVADYIKKYGKIYLPGKIFPVNIEDAKLTNKKSGIYNSIKTGSEVLLKEIETKIDGRLKGIFEYDKKTYKGSIALKYLANSIEMPLEEGIQCLVVGENPQSGTGYRLQPCDENMAYKIENLKFYKCGKVVEFKLIEKRKTIRGVFGEENTPGIINIEDLANIDIQVMINSGERIKALVKEINPQNDAYLLEVL